MTLKVGVSYSGDTSVKIKSAKHDTSNAFMHAHTLIKLFKCRDIPLKPILLMETDGAKDKAPQCPKPMYTAVYLLNLVYQFSLVKVTCVAIQSS